MTATGDDDTGGGTAGTPPGPPPGPDPRGRFSDRADAYVRGRPGYPEDAVTFATEGLPLQARVVDVGAGTGILTQQLLERGLDVIALEPNPAMRAAATRELARHVGVEVRDGTAEVMGLPDQSVDLVTCAQTFHWLDPVAFRRECLRVLRPSDGRVAILWNQRRRDDSAFARAYEAFLEEHGVDYAAVSARYDDPAALAAFYGDRPAPWRRVFPHTHRLDLDALLARAASSSYLPGPDDPRHGAMVAALRALFARHAGTVTGGVPATVEMGYDCVVYVGRPAAMG